MAGLARWVRLFVVYCAATFWGLFVCVGIVIDTLKHGKSVFKRTKREKPAGLSDRVYGEHKFVTIREDDTAGKGVNIHYVTKGDKQKELMLLVHGFPEIWYSWRHQIKAFSQDYWVVAIDQRGYGESDKPDGVENYSLDNLTKDIKAIVHALGRQSVILVGHDWGGVVSWATAGRYPELVKKLIIMNCPHSLAIQKFAATSLKQILKSWYIWFFQLPFLPEFFMASKDFAGLKTLSKTTNPEGMTEEYLEAVIYYLQSPNGLTGPLNYYRALVRHPFRTSKEMLRMPVQIIWGTNDMALSTELASLSCAYTADVTLNHLEGISHWVQQDDPDSVNRLVLKYLSK